MEKIKTKSTARKYSVWNRGTLPDRSDFRCGGSIGRGIQITPDFEEKRLEGNLLVKGRISLFTIGIILIRIFVRGEWRRFRREAERLKEAL